MHRGRVWYMGWGCTAGPVTTICVIPTAGTQSCSRAPVPVLLLCGHSAGVCSAGLLHAAQGWSTHDVCPVCAMGCAAGLVHCPPRAPSAFQSPRHTQLPPSPDPQIGPPAPPPCSPARGPRLSGAAAPGSATWRGKERAGGKRGMERGGKEEGPGPSPPSRGLHHLRRPPWVRRRREGGREGWSRQGGMEAGGREGGRDERRSCVICLSLLCALKATAARVPPRGVSLVSTVTPPRKAGKIRSRASRPLHTCRAPPAPLMAHVRKAKKLRFMAAGAGRISRAGMRQWGEAGWGTGRCSQCNGKREFARTERSVVITVLPAQFHAEPAEPSLTT